MTDDFHYSGPNKDKDDDDPNREKYILLPLSPKLKEAQVVTMLGVKPTNSKKGTAGYIELQLNHKYEKKTVISDVTDSDWTKTIKTFIANAKRKGVTNEHIEMITDILDENIGKIVGLFESARTKEANIVASLAESRKEAVVTAALEFVEKHTVKLFLNQVNTPYIAVKIKNHTETMPLISQTFEDWLPASFYYHQKELAKEKDKKRQSLGGAPLGATCKVISPEDIKKVQTILRFETTKEGKIIKLNSRVCSLHQRLRDNTTYLRYVMQSSNR